MVNEEYRPRIPYPNATRKDCSDEQFGELTLHVEDETITLQARTSGITSNSEGNGLHQSTKTNNMTQLTLQKLSFKEVHEPCSSNDRGYTLEEQRLRIEELDEWRAHKLRTHDKPKLLQNKADTSPNQLKVGDKVLLDAADHHIVTTTPNEEIPLTVLSIFPFGTVEHTRPGTRACSKPWPNRGRDTAVRYGRVEAGHDFPKTRDTINPHSRATWPYIMSSSRGKKAAVPSSKRRRGPGSSSRAASEGSNLYRPLHDAPHQTLRPPQHCGPVISAYTDMSDVPIGYHNYVTHEDDRAPT
ncbi:hypothetical protein GOBAR_AA28819 [Gossypium barbadense]|uniref:Uncharacterized protein n=1 Tax=Gossypium barbadense TaxID=3634 RepID=A0A2P5WL86_GOSBA|nr:hypothetical protein GOBAR_AA28819 [Gossypium barbadense]